MLTPFEQMIADAIASDGTDNAEHVSRVIAGVSASPDWRDLQFLTPALASGSLAVALAARAVAISTALKSAATTPSAPSAAPQKPVHERYDMSAQEWRALPPSKKRELTEAAAKHDERETQVATATDVAKLQAKAEAGTITPVERLTLSRLTEAAATKEQRRDPVWRRSQEERASLKTLRETKRGHDLTAASGAYPPTYREMHREHSERIGRIIAERVAAGET